MDNTSTTDALKALVAHVVELKKAGADAGAVADACRAGTALLLGLRQGFRAAALGGERAREATLEAKAELDRFVLQLHNLLYERQFVEREIASCRSFKSAVPDDAVGLIPEDELLASGASADAAAAAAAGDAHALMLARLGHELDGRRRLAAELEGARAERASEAEKAAAAKAKLDALRSALSGLEQAGRPLAAALGPRAAPRPQQRAAALLPMPLWVIYSQFAAARDALGLPVDVDVEGSIDDAARLAAAAAAEAAAEASGGGGGGGGAGTAAEAAGATAAATTAAAAAGAAAGNAAGGGGGAAGAPPSKRRKPDAEQADEGVYRTHPLTVVLSLLDPRRRGAAAAAAQLQPRPLLTVRFQHYSALGLVGAFCGGGADDARLAAAEEDEAVLGALFPGDAGDGEGLEAVARLAGRGPYEFGSEAARARPYRWAQDLGGADLVPAGAPAGAASEAEARAAALEGLAQYRRQRRALAVFERLHEAREAAAALEALVAELSKGRAPATPLDGAVPCALATKLASWKAAAGAAPGAAAGVAAAAAAARGGLRSRPPSRQDSGQPPTRPGTAGGSGRGPAAASAATTAAAAPAASAEEGEVEEGAAGEVASGGAAAARARAAAIETAATLDEDELLGGLLDDEPPEAAAKGGGMAAAAAGAPLSAAAAAAAEAADDAGGGAASDDDALAEAADDGDGGAGGDAAAAAAAAAALTPAATYRAVLRAPALEVAATVRLYRCYPLVPPRWTVDRITPLVAGRAAPPAAGAPGGGAAPPPRPPPPNERLWLEREANAEALRWAAGAGCAPQLLGVQLLRLRWAADRLAAKLAAQPPPQQQQPQQQQQQVAGSGNGGSGIAGGNGTGGDLMGVLQARQQLRGPARHAQLVTL